jgi:hypothetical protein
VGTLKGFWSYAHADDDADGGRISALARDVVSQYEMLTGENIELFLDRDAIEWGENWRAKIDDNLASIAFFIAVLTPRYFMSVECRRELNTFAHKATELGVEELVLPLLYVPVVSLQDDSDPDDLVSLVGTLQWEDWSDLRFADVGSEEYRRGVARLAARLVEANTKADQTDIAARVQALEDSADWPTGEAPGLLDRLADAEEAMPKWTTTVEAITQEMELIGEAVQRSAEDTKKGDAQGKGFAARLAVARRLSHELLDPVERVWALGNEFSSQLHVVDEGVRVIVASAPSEAADDPDAKATLCEFFETLRGVSRSTNEALASIDGMLSAMAPVEAMSRDLRGPLKRLRQGLTMILEARQIVDEWVRLIDDADVACSDAPDADA